MPSKFLDVVNSNRRSLQNGKASQLLAPTAIELDTPADLSW
jgi:hypothetical protein